MNQLTNAVYELIRKHSPKQATRFKKQFDRSEAMNVLRHGELVTLNKYWRIELGCIRKNTFSERECLSDSVTPELWLSNFATYILPTVLQEDLPIRS